MASGQTGCWFENRREALANRRERSQRDGEIFVRDLPKNEAAHLPRYGLDLLDGVSPCPRQRQAFGAAIGFVLAPLDEFRLLQRIKQTHHRGAVERERRSQLVLPHRRRRAEDADERQPCRLGEPVGLQPPVERAPPFAGEVRDEGREARSGILRGERHRANRTDDGSLNDISCISAQGFDNKIYRAKRIGPPNLESAEGGEMAKGASVSLWRQARRSRRRLPEAGVRRPWRRPRLGCPLPDRGPSPAASRSPTPARPR